MTNAKNAAAGIKRCNRAGIYRILREGGPLSRQDILRQLRLSLPTVTQNLAELQAEGLIAETGFLGNTGGRNARTYSAVGDARIAVGLDVTGDHITAAAVDLLGNLLARVSVRRPFARTDEYARALASMVDGVVRRTMLPVSKVLGVGIGVPGLVSADHRSVAYGETIGFTGGSCGELAKYMPYPAFLYHDVNAACFAEAWFQPNLENAFYLMINNSIGGTILMGGRPYYGENFRSGEIGHLKLAPEGRRCYCGGCGCVDSYINAALLSSLTDGNLAAFFDALQAGEAFAAQAWDEYTRCLALTVHNLRMLFDCKIILGGYIGGCIDPYMDGIRAAVAKLNPFESNADYLIPCSCKKETVATGAALYLLSDFISAV